MKRFCKKAVCLLLAVVLGAALCGCKPIVPSGDVHIDYSFEDDHLIGLCELLLPNVVELRYGSSFATGFLYTDYDGDAIYVTNFHIGGGDTFEAGFVDARFFGETSFRKEEMTVLGHARYYDVVFLRSKTRPQNAIDLRAKQSSDLRMGQRVLAIGNGMGTGLAAAEGIIAQPDKIVTVGDSVVPAVQISAPINAGNSGSPLFNMKGELIGLNFAQTTSLAGSDRFVDGVSYSLPIGLVDALFAAAVNNPGGAIPYTDTVLLTEKSASKEFSAFLKYGNVYVRKDDTGLRVTGKGATALSALEADDYIESVGGVVVSGYGQLVIEMLRYGETGTGEALSFGVLRGGEHTTVTEKGYTCKRYVV